MSIVCVAGLGNPGTLYAETRHNIGFIVLDALAKELEGQWQQNLRLKALLATISIDGNKIQLLKPQSFMNLSGQVIQNLAQYFKLLPENIVVVCDDINIPLGKVKISVGGSAGGHNGLENIISYCGDNFIRFRVGIGQKEHSEMDLKDHVLGKFTENEKTVLTSCIPQYIKDLKYLILNGPIMAMNLINPKNKTGNDHDKSTS